MPDFIYDFMTMPITIATIIDSIPSNKNIKYKEAPHSPKKKIKYTDEYQNSDVEEIALL